MLAALSAAQLAAQGSYQHFEARQVHPLALCPDGNTLLALDSANARLCRFDLREDPPRRLPPIPVGLEPTTVRARNNDEVWVCNEVSDSVSVISLQANAVMDTLVVGDEPTDLIFAQNRAFVICARSRELRVFDASSRLPLGSIPLQGLQPHALALNSDGSRLWVACLLSGNRTTVLPRERANPQGSPGNPALPAAPITAEIVSAQDPRVAHEVLDHDLIEVDTGTLQVISHRGDVGTHLFDLSLRPGSRELWIGTQDSRNLTRFEPALRGHVVDSGLVVIGDSTQRRHDLNPGLDYSLLPNAAAQATALAMPTSLCFNLDGSQLWVAAFGSDRIARIDPSDGSITARIDLRVGGDTSAAAMRGPRGLVLDESRGRLYVLNKLSSSLTVLETSGLTLLHELALSLHDPMPAAIRRGRGYLFDARLSGNGTVSCASCHLDADRDGLAWDLGDPQGEMVTVLGANLSVHDKTPRPRVLHPMKGPMVTQTLRGLAQGAPFHWRGDRPTLQSFNSTFDKLMGGSLQEDADMNDLAAYLNSLAHHSNPNRNLDRSLPAGLAGGNPIIGRDLFNNHSRSHCNTCHSLPQGSDHNLDLPQEAGLIQPVKNPPLRTLYQRLDFDPRAGIQSLSGFGLLHDGSGGRSLLPTVHPYVLDQLSTPAEFTNLTAFLLCFDTGTARSVGHAVTLNSQRLERAELISQISTLEARASLPSPDCDLVVMGKVAGTNRQWLWKAGRYLSDKATEAAATRTALLAMLGQGDSITFMGVLPGSGPRFGNDEDGDGVPNGDDPAPNVANGPPQILSQPSHLAVSPLTEARFEVTARGGELTYQWRRGTSAVGGNSNSLILAGATSADAGEYSVTVSNRFGSVTSNKATLRVVPSAQITRQPQPLDLAEGSTATLSVVASGSNLSYQWYRGTQPVGGAVQSTLRLVGIGVSDAGDYRVEVSNGATSLFSQPARLSVRPWPVVQPLNLPDIMVGETVDWALSASQQPTRYYLSGLPAGLQFDAASGRIRGRATQAATLQLAARAGNANGIGRITSQILRVLPLHSSAVGNFSTLLPRHQSTSLGHQLGGLLQLTCTSAASFSGMLQLGESNHSFSGSLQSAPSADVTGRVSISRRNQPNLELNLNLSRSTALLQVSLSDASGRLDATGRRLKPTAVDLAAAYTLALKPPRSGSGPQGSSVAALTLSAKGAGLMNLRLADGSAGLVHSSALLEDNSMPILLRLNQNKASLLGQIRLSDSGSLNASEMSWMSHPHVNSRAYRGGFASLPLKVVGRRYQMPAPGQLVMGLMPTANNAQLRFGGASLTDASTRLDWAPFQIKAGNPSVIVAPIPNPAALSLSLLPGSGSFAAGKTACFSGSFTLSDQDPPGTEALRRRASFFGMLVDDGNGLAGHGFFNIAELPSQAPSGSTLLTSPMLSGWVELGAYTFSAP